MLLIAFDNNEAVWHKEIRALDIQAGPSRMFSLGFDVLIGKMKNIISSVGPAGFAFLVHALHRIPSNSFVYCIGETKTFQVIVTLTLMNHN